MDVLPYNTAFNERQVKLYSSNYSTMYYDIQLYTLLIRVGTGYL